MKIGEHEFEAEGPAESVKQQLDAFRELIGLGLSSKKEDHVIDSDTSVEDEESKPVAQANNRPPLDRIMRANGRIISLTALPSSTEDAVLLIIVGHSHYRNNESVTGQEIGDGLAQSGRSVERVDRIMLKPLKEGLVLKSGLRRSTRYRLTNQGYQKALNIAKDLLASLP
jgi:hypothetical protein